MKILWICNKAPSIIYKFRNKNANPMGGWLDQVCEDILNIDNTQLFILFRDKENVEGKIKNLEYCSFDISNHEYRICNAMLKFEPDIIHLWGTEYRHTLTGLNLAERHGYIEKCVLSIQGLVSLIGKYHYTEGLPNRIIKMYTIRDLIKRSNIMKEKKNFIKCGIYEKCAIEKTKHIIGRTDWDKAATEMINPNAIYHFCNETLRNVFYNSRWDINKIKRHSIFVSQCNYPVKGFHYLLEAMPEILKNYPNAHIYTTGVDLIHLSLKDKIKMTSYQKYLRSLIFKYELQDNITFLGLLSEKEMCEQYLQANVFVSASTIENSPNSVGEAMLVGCPVVASDVGGVKNMLIHGKEGYVYQSSAPYMLAYYVKQMFENEDIALKFSDNGRAHAKITHSRENNINQLLKIYFQIHKANKIM